MTATVLSSFYFIFSFAKNSFHFHRYFTIGSRNLFQPHANDIPTARNTEKSFIRLFFQHTHTHTPTHHRPTLPPTPQPNIPLITFTHAHLHTPTHTYAHTFCLSSEHYCHSPAALSWNGSIQFNIAMIGADTRIMTTKYARYVETLDVMGL